MTVWFHQKPAKRHTEQRFTTSNTKIWDPTSIGDNTTFSSVNLCYWHHLGLFRLFQLMALICHISALSTTPTILSWSSSYKRLLEEPRHVVKLSSRPPYQSVLVSFMDNVEWSFSGCRFPSFKLECFALCMSTKCQCSEKETSTSTSL